MNFLHSQNANSPTGFKKSEYRNKILNIVLNLQTRAQLMNAANDCTLYSNDN